MPSLPPFNSTYSFLKASEGGQSQKDVLSLLKSEGIEAYPASSCYVGHTAVIVRGGARNHKRAERLIYGDYK